MATGLSAQYNLYIILICSPIPTGARFQRPACAQGARPSPCRLELVPMHMPGHLSSGIGIEFAVPFHRSACVQFCPSLSRCTAFSALHEAP
jgi:hypothetical protein